MEYYTEGLVLCQVLRNRAAQRRVHHLAGLPLGEDLENEPVHMHPASLHCAAVGGEIHCGIAGFPICPDHDSPPATIPAATFLP